MYLAYEPLSKKGDSSTFVPAELFEAQQQAKSYIPIKYSKNWDNWVAEELGVDKDYLWNLFSSEQIDSIGLTIYNFYANKNFIIADETGIGKGRILSGICRWAFKNNKKVMFFTEREHLFTDFWRDLIDTDTIDLLKNPTVFHADAKVLNKNNEVVLKSSIKEIQKIQNEGFLPDCNLVMTNYSQVSLTQHKKNKKDSMVEFCSDNIIILDECHNATGDSNTKKFLLSLFDHCKHIVFSSATFLKDENQLDLYEKSIDFDEETLHLFKRLLKNDSNRLLRKVFTYELTRKLQLWRREHEPLDIGWKTIVCDNTDEQERYINQYSNVINNLFSLSFRLSKQPALQELNLGSGWYSMGSTINRLSRNLLLLLKVDTLVSSVEQSLEKQHKAVVVVDSTFSSIINKVIEFQKITTKSENYELNFKQVLYYIINDYIGIYINKYKEVINHKILADYQALLAQAIAFEDLSISPIDMIRNKLISKNIPVNEISGRTFRINSNNLIEKIQKISKPKLVAEFNSGEVNVIILTRAGASGISLHSSSTFKDQRVRDLYELEITNRPTYRLQFIGRVNRKNQVNQPEFFIVITSLPFEQRILNVEQQKLKKLQSHISGDDDKIIQENIHNFYTEYCNNSTYQFLNNNKELAFQMGIQLKENKEDFYFIDSILKRCIILNSEQQNFIYDYLIYCTECEQKLNIKKSLPDSIKYEHMNTFWQQLNSTQQNDFRKQYANMPQLAINQFKYQWVGIMQITSTYKVNALYSLKNKQDLEINKQNNEDIKKHLTQSLGYYYGITLYNKDYLNEKVAPVIKDLNIGSCITIKSVEGNIFGYIHNVSYSKIPKSYQFDNLTLIHIKTVNPDIHNSIHYSPEDYYLTLKELVELDYVKIYNDPIDWNKFDRTEKFYNRVNYCLIGHPIYMEFLRQAYGMGEIKYFNVGGKKNMCVLLPNNLDLKTIKSIKKPIYKANKIMEGLISKSINSLSSTWQNHDFVKPVFKLEQTTGGYNLFIASEIYKNKDLIDYPLVKKLNNRKGNSNGYEIFLVPYKEIRLILLMLEKREVIWFIN